MLKGAAVPKYQMSIFDAGFTGGGADREYKPDIVQESTKDPAAKITDPFGEHIGGARKELWRGRGLGHDDITLMNSMERDKYIKKDNIWKKPDYIDMIRRGGLSRLSMPSKSDCQHHTIPNQRPKDSQLYTHNADCCGIPYILYLLYILLEKLTTFTPADSPGISYFINRQLFFIVVVDIFGHF